MEFIGIGIDDIYHTPQDDGYELGPIQLKKGKIIEGCRVWEGPTEVWECDDISMQEIEKGTTLDDGRMVLDASQQDDIYRISSTVENKIKKIKN